MTISKLPTSASLRQIMDKFEEISLQDFSSIDIITASYLPSMVKNGQIVIITSTKPSKIYISTDASDITLGNTDILLCIGGGTKRTLTSSSKEFKLPFASCIQNGKYLAAYYGDSNRWVQITLIETYMLQAGTVKIGSFSMLNASSNKDTMLANGALNLKANNSRGSSYCHIGNSEELNLDKYSKMFVKISSLYLPAVGSSQTGINNYIDFGLSSELTGSSTPYMVKQSYSNKSSAISYTDITVEFNIATISSAYFIVRAGCTLTSGYNEIHITDIYFT